MGPARASGLGRFVIFDEGHWVVFGSFVVIGFGVLVGCRIIIGPWIVPHSHHEHGVVFDGSGRFSAFWVFV